MLILLTDVDGRDDATTRAEGLRRAMAVPVPTPGGGPDLIGTVSIGVTIPHPATQPTR